MAGHVAVPSVNSVANPGRLYLIPTPLDHGCAEQTPLAEVLPLATITRAARLTNWICENAKSARSFLKRVHAVAPLALPIQQMTITELAHQLHKKGDHDIALPHEPARQLLHAALHGEDIGLISEAGMPALADPGSSVVRAAHELGIGVVPMIGPISIGLALAASGFNGQNFAFAGYLPRTPSERISAIQTLEKRALSSGQTQIFIETPYRNAALLEALLGTLRPSTRLCMATGLTLPQATVWSHPISQWRERTLPEHVDLPAVFAIGR